MYKLIQEFQFTDSTNTIIVLKPGTTITESGGVYKFEYRKKSYIIDFKLIENNPSFFKKEDIKTRIVEMLKKYSGSTYVKRADLVIDLFNSEFIGDRELVDSGLLETALNACRLQYLATNDVKWLIPIDSLGYTADENGVVKV